MKVSAIRLHHLVAPLTDTIGNALVFFKQRETLLVEVVGSNGMSGWGESWSAPAAVAAAIAASFAPCVLGQDPAHTGRLWHAMRRAAGHERQGVAAMAIAALDIALHDLAARARGVPVHALLGGALRDRVQAYASGPFFRPDGHPYRHYERDVESYLREGFRAFKLRIGYGPADDATVVAAIRKIIGPDAALMVDFNQSCSPRAAMATAARLAEANLLWLEEPTTPGDLDGYRQVSGQVTPALAGGETFGDAAAFLPFLQAGCMDVLQPDIAICGGVTGTNRVVALAEAYGRPVVPHVWGSTVNFHAALHLTATLPLCRAGGESPFPWMEYDVGPNPLLDLAGRPTVGTDGAVLVPDGPGLGIEIEAAQLTPFTVWQRTLSAEPELGAVSHK
jgi:D-galactarolactone cycloisomerase